MADLSEANCKTQRVAVIDCGRSVILTVMVINHGLALKLLELTFSCKGDKSLL